MNRPIWQQQSSFTKKQMGNNIFDLQCVHCPVSDRNHLEHDDKDMMKQSYASNLLTCYCMALVYVHLYVVQMFLWQLKFMWPLICIGEF
jgi:hypothetical protein